MTIAKEERHKLELEVFGARHEAGLRAAHAWLKLRQGEINAQWPEAPTEELHGLQGEARALAKLVKLIETGPAIRPAPPKVS